MDCPSRRGCCAGWQSIRLVEPDRRSIGIPYPPRRAWLWTVREHPTSPGFLPSCGRWTCRPNPHVLHPTSCWKAINESKRKIKLLGRSLKHDIGLVYITAALLANSKWSWSIFSSTRSASSNAWRRDWVSDPSRSHWSQISWQRALTEAVSW